jgi:hypothetical protein
VIANGLAKVLAGADLQHRRVARLGEEHAQAEPGEVAGAEPLDAAKRRRVRGEQRGDAGDREPHQHLVAGDDAERRGEAAANAALAGRGDEGEVAGARDHQEDDHGDHERRVVGDSEHGSTRGSNEARLSFAGGADNGASLARVMSIPAAAHPASPPVEPLAAFLGEVRAAFASGAFGSLVLSKPRDPSSGPSATRVRLIALKGAPALSFVATHATRDVTRNLGGRGGCRRDRRIACDPAPRRRSRTATLPRGRRRHAAARQQEGQGDVAPSPPRTDR